MVPVGEIEGVAGRGIVGDAGAAADGLRHVLIVAERDLRALGVGAAGLRANVVVDGELEALASGSVVTFGELALRITIGCEACGRLDEVRAGLAKEVGARRGVLARVVGSGRVRIGERGRMAGRAMRALDGDWKERVLEIVRNVPAGSVISYAALARAAGVQATYCRALPSVLRGLAARGAPVERVVPERAVAARPLWDAGGYYAAQERRAT
jgi:alkylated DNA nucleotide flippase Atl1